MTIQIVNQTEGFFKAPVTLSYRSGICTTRPGQGAWGTKPARTYTVIAGGRQAQISEGRFKKLKKQHEARNRYLSGARQRVFIRQGYCTIQL